MSTDEDTSLDLRNALEVTDVSPSDTLTWTVVSAPSNGVLSGVDGESESTAGSSNLHTLSSSPTYTPDADFAGSDSFEVKVEDDNPGTSETITVDVTVNEVIEAPTALSLSSTKVDRSTGTDAAVGEFTTTDPDDSTHSYSLVGGAGDDDNGEFSIDGDTLRADDQSSLGAGTYSVRVQAADDTGATIAKSFSISVTLDVAVPPELGTNQSSGDTDDSGTNDTEDDDSGINDTEDDDSAINDTDDSDESSDNGTADTDAESDETGDVESDEEETGGAGEDGAGFGVVVAVLAMVGLAVIRLYSHGRFSN